MQLTPEQEKLLYQIIGKRLRLRRKAIGLKQEELSKKIGFESRSSIANIELGNQKTPLHVLYSIARFLGVEMHEIIPSLDDLHAMANEAESIKINYVPKSELGKLLSALVNSVGSHVDFSVVREIDLNQAFIQADMRL